MKTKKELLKHLLQASLWLLLLTGVLAFALVRINQSIALAFVPLILYWALHWVAYLLHMAISKAMSKIDKRLIEAERGRDISKHTLRTLIVGMGISLSTLVVVGFQQEWWLYVMSAGLFVWGVGLGMMFPGFITHTEKEVEEQLGEPN